LLESAVFAYLLQSCIDLFQVLFTVGPAFFQLDGFLEQGLELFANLVWSKQFILFLDDPALVHNVFE